ncbi:MAG TPA: SpoIIE family protein phosphatase, partial [Thermoanaerobaculia bacterium]
MPARRKAIGLSIAIAVLIGLTVYCSWRVGVANRRGWAGFSYVPPVGSSGRNAPALGGFRPGAVLVIFGGVPAEQAGLHRGDVIVSINGIAARDFKNMRELAVKAKRGDVLRYRILRDGRERDIPVRLDSPLKSSMFALNFIVTTAVALTFLLIGAFVFWRRPADNRATVFFAMTLVAAVTLANTALLPVEGDGYRGIVGGDQSLGALWRVILIGGSSLFFAPLLLHLALIFPAPRPAMQRRGILRWIYGYPLMMCIAGGLGMGFIAYLEAFRPKGDLITNAATIAVAVIGIGALAWVIVNIARHGAKEGVMRSPLAMSAAVLSLFAGIFVVAGNLSGKSHSPIPFFVATFVMILVGIATFGAYPVATFVALLRSYRESGVEERRQVKWPLWATMVAVGGKLLLAVLGFTLVLLATFRQVNIPGVLMTLPDIIARALYIIIPLSFAFAILKYRLMNIDVIIRRTVLYSFLTAIVFVLYAILVAGLGTALVKFAGMTSQTMLVASTVVIALVTVPIRNRLQRVVDRNLFRERRDYPLALRNISNAIGTSGDVEPFLRYSAEQIQQALQNRLVLIAIRRDREYVVTAKVGIADEVLGTRVPADIDPAGIPEPLRKRGATLLIPVKTYRESVALLALGSKLSDEDFSADDREFLNSAAGQMAVGIENLRLRGEEVEFEQARAMQQILLPTRFPQLDGFGITGAWQPARSVGGDYFDTLSLGDRKAGICIGDVAGKGMPAALLMANLQAAVKATASAAVAPAIVCERVKEIVGGNLSGGKFISFFYGVLDASARTFTYSNAGHNPPILVRADGTVERLARGGPAMSRLFKDTPHEQDAAVLGAGDRIVLFTDGVSEARRGEEEFGDDRIIELILRCRHLGARELQEKILEELRQFSTG